MKRLAVYDLEIKNAIEDIPGGWSNHAAMGISCLGLYDYNEDRYKVYDDYTKTEFLENYFMNPQVDLISFNGLKFDDKVVQTNWMGITKDANPPVPLPVRLCGEYDILDQVWKSLGRTNFHKGVSLGALCESTLFIPKSGPGALAPTLFKEGRIGELVTYCLHDVWMTKLLFEFIRIHGFVISPEYSRISLEIPYDLSVGRG